MWHAVKPSGCCPLVVAYVYIYEQDNAVFSTLSVSFGRFGTLKCPVALFFRTYQLKFHQHAKFAGETGKAME